MLPYRQYVVNIDWTPYSESVLALRLDPVGLLSAEPIPRLSLPYQVAANLHACTDPLDGVRMNDRVGDLLDPILVEELSPNLSLLATRKALGPSCRSRVLEPGNSPLDTCTGNRARWSSTHDSYLSTEALPARARPLGFRGVPKSHTDARRPSGM